MKKTRLLVLSILMLVVLSVTGCSEDKVHPPQDPPAQDSVQENSGPAASENTSAPAKPATPPSPAPDPTPVPIPPPAPAPESDATAVPSPESTPESSADTAPVPTPPADPSVPPDTATDPVPPASPDEEESVPGYHEQVPILMYHEVNDLLANNLYLSVEDFKTHLAYFEEAGITPISMQQLYDHWFNEAPLPEKPIVLTFDDGYRSMYTTVYPLLKEKGWSGTFYCITDCRWSDNFLLSDMIAEMAANGMEIGSHTASHVELNSLTGESLSYELTESMAVLSSITGSEVPMLCYPAGRYNEETKSAAEEAGYRFAVTTVNGIASRSQGAFELNRIRVNKECGGSWIEKTLAPLGY